MRSLLNGRGVMRKREIGDGTVHIPGFTTCQSCGRRSNLDSCGSVRHVCVRVCVCVFRAVKQRSRDLLAQDSIGPAATLQQRRQGCREAESLAQASESGGSVSDARNVVLCYAVA